MGCFASSSYLPVPQDDVVSLKKNTKFTQGEIDYLYTRFRELGSPTSKTLYLVRKDFFFPSYALHSLILTEMFGEKHRISFVDFATFLSIFKALSSKATDAERKLMKTKKLKLMFNLYDTTKDGNISKGEVLDVVHKLYSNYVNFRTIVQMTNALMKELDPQNTNRILFDDFCEVMEPFDMDQLVIKFPTL